MRPSARIPSILAGLVLAAGALVAAPAATAAPAGVQDCEQYIVKHGKQVTDAAGQACYEGAIGNQTSCAASLQEAGLSADVADGACRAAR